jgi:hypothetical protein
LKLSRVLFVFSAALLAFTGTAHSSVITLEFTGSVAQVPLDELFGDINFGDAIQGSFSYDTSAADLIPADSSTGSYTFGAPFGMNVSIGAHNFITSGSLNIGILNAFVDQFSVLAMNTAGDLTLELLLQDNAGAVFTNDHLPSSAPSLAAFAQRDFHLDALFAGGEVQVDGRIGTLAVQAVPEPLPQSGVAAGVFVLLALARYRRRVSQSIN